MRTNWRVGSLFKIPLYIDSSWLLILALVTLINAEDIQAQGLTQGVPFLGWLIGLAMALLLFGSVLLHELGHSLVARSQGIKVNSITLFLFGGIASIDRESKNPIEALFVAIAGPLVSLSLFGIFFLLNSWLTASTLLQFVTSDLARINLVLGVFNLIPGLPLDGGQILKALVWKYTGDRFTGVHWAAKTGKIIGYLGISFGLFLVLFTSTFSALWLSFIGWFILQNASAYDRITSLQEDLLKVVASEVMSHEFRVINANLTLQAFAQDYILSDSKVQMMYYAASEGRYRGLIRVQDLQSIERSEWDSKTLMDVVHPLHDIPSVTEKTPLIEVIQQLEAIRDLAITVLSPAGAVAGVIDRGDIVKVVANRQKLTISEAEIKQIKTEGVYPAYLPLAAIAKTVSEA
jgi:Zn-dependent protease